MVVTLDDVFHIIALGKIRADAALRVGGGTFAAFAHPHVYAVADLNLRSGEISAGNVERILRLHVVSQIIYRRPALKQPALQPLALLGPKPVLIWPTVDTFACMVGSLDLLTFAVKLIPIGVS